MTGRLIRVLCTKEVSPQYYFVTYEISELWKKTVQEHDIELSVDCRRGGSYCRYYTLPRLIRHQALPQDSMNKNARENAYNKRL